MRQYTYLVVFAVYAILGFSAVMIGYVIYRRLLSKKAEKLDTPQK